MDRSTFKSLMADAGHHGTLLVPKHDPNHLGSCLYDSYRTVLTPEMSGSLDTFLASEDYDADHYSDGNYPGGAGYIVLKPKPACGIAVIGLGVPPKSATTSGSADVLVVVSGSQSGWHVYAESTLNVTKQMKSARLALSGSF